MHLHTYTLNLNEADFPPSEQKMTKTFHFFKAWDPQYWIFEKYYFKELESGFNSLSVLRQFIALSSTFVSAFFILLFEHFRVCMLKCGVDVCGTYVGTCVYEDQRSTSGTVPLSMNHLIFFVFVSVLFYLIQSFFTGLKCSSLDRLSARLCLPCAGITSMHRQTWHFMCILGIKTEPSPNPSLQFEK